MDMKDAMKFDVAVEIIAGMVGKRIARLSRIENNPQFINEVKQIKFELSNLRKEKRALYMQDETIIQKALEVYGKEIAAYLNENTENVG